MAFAEINIQEIIQEKKNNSEEFYNTWKNIICRNHFYS